MAAERDQAGSSGSGMSGAGRDAGGLNAGTSGSSSMGDRGLGSAEVHTGLHSGGGDEYSGLQFAGQRGATAAAGCAAWPTPCATAFPRVPATWAPRPVRRPPASASGWAAWASVPAD